MSSTIVSLENIGKCFADQVVIENLCLNVYTGEFLTLLGPSGCGKTTLMRLLAGFIKPDHGRILLKGEDITSLPPEQRHLNLVFQSYALFPHMSVFENVAFGLRAEKKYNESDIALRVNEMLARVKLDAFAHRKPKQLSGGQQQRVAIARAAVKQPDVLLLDEPLSALDHHLRRNMQIELKALQRRLGITFIFVTHDQEEALSMSDRVVVMNQGRIEQIGTPRDIYEEPNNIYVAKFIGEANIFTCQVENIDHEYLYVTIAERPAHFKNAQNFKPGDTINIILRPEDITVWGKSEIDETTDTLPGIVSEVIYKGSTVDLRVTLADGTLVSATEFFDEDDENLFYEIGEPVWVDWQAGWEVILADE